ncbi:MAG: lysophospholipid acyltransferase family protein [Thermoanaerobaculia bacterium]
MRLDPDTRLGSLATTVTVWLLDLLIRVLSRTCRLEVVEGSDVLDEVVESRRPVVFCFWHNRIVPAAGLLLRRIVPAGMDVTLLSSPSRDGELSARFMQRHGARVVRGSSSRGGARGLRGILQVVRRHGSSPVVIPDGPKGPPYRFKAGVLGLSRMTGAPVLLLGFAAERAWTVGTWDRMILPRPFSRVAVAVAPPVAVPRDLPDEELEAQRRALEERLSALDRTAEAAVGAVDPLAPGEAAPTPRPRPEPPA